MDATTVTTEGNAFRVKFSGQAETGTEDLTAGQYVLTVWATNGDDRYTVGQWPMTVTADLATGAPAQSHAQKMLSLCETAIYNRVNGNSDGGIESYAIDGTQVNKLSIDQLEKLRAKYAAEVARESGRGQIPRLKTVFTAAGHVPELRRRYS